MEQWAQIGDTHYSVSTEGRVRNDETGRILYLRDHKSYYSAHLYNHGKDYTIQVHRLVANAFIDNPNNKAQVNHIDGDKHNNNVENLEWVTGIENQRHAVTHGLYPNAICIKCVETGESFVSIGEAERQTGIPNSCISDCLHGICSHAHGFHFKYA